MNINQRKHKQEGKIVYWWNGEKYLIRQTCKTIKQAKELLKEWKTQN